MDTRSVIAGAGGTVVIAAALIVSASAQAGEPAPVARHSTVESVAALPAVRAGDEVCTGQEVVGRYVDLIAWAEIRELRNLGLPVCDVEWKFYDIPGIALGGALMNTDGTIEVWVEALEESWAPEHDPALSIRSIVRHEYGHALVYTAGYYGEEDGHTLRGTFTEPLWREDAPSPGHEAAAEAVAAVLADMRGDDRRSYYVTDVGDASRTAAREFVTAVTR